MIMGGALARAKGILFIPFVGNELYQFARSDS